VFRFVFVCKVFWVEFQRHAAAAAALWYMAAAAAAAAALG